MINDAKTAAIIRSSYSSLKVRGCVLKSTAPTANADDGRRNMSRHKWLRAHITAALRFGRRLSRRIGVGSLRPMNDPLDEISSPNPRKSTQWISVGERLPQRSTPVLAWATWDGTDTCQVVAEWRYTNRDNTLRANMKVVWRESMNQEYKIYGVTHWMPPPEGPG